MLVIDDLHELRSAEALAQLEALLARRPPLLRVVLATRHDPQLGLHRLRLAGQLTEVRAADLRFSLDETRELLATSGIALSDQGVSLLHARTEGWAAGLRLAALSLARHPQPERFVAEFAGSERTVADYLLAEVLERQPDHVRRLLLRTSILERVNGALADVLVGASGSERILHELEAANAFVVSLDAGRAWFRYHHLFADLLRLELRRTEPDAVGPLHRTAAEWYAAHGEVTEAVRHAQAAGDWAHAARLLVDGILTLSLKGQHATLAALIAAFPPEAPPDPELALLFGYREMTQGSLDGAAAYLTLAERHAPEVAAERRRRFEVVLAVTRLSLARRRGDFGAVLERVQALRGPAEAETLSEVGLSNEARATALMNLGIVELWSYRLDDARRHLEQGLALARQIGLAYVEVGCLSHLAVTDAWRSFALVRERCARGDRDGGGAGPVDPADPLRRPGDAGADGRRASPLRGGARLARARRRGAPTRPRARHGAPGPARAGHARARPGPPRGGARRLPRRRAAAGPAPDAARPHGADARVARADAAATRPDRGGPRGPGRALGRGAPVGRGAHGPRRRPPGRGGRAVRRRRSSVRCWTAPRPCCTRAPSSRRCSSARSRATGSATRAGPRATSSARSTSPSPTPSSSRSCSYAGRPAPTPPRQRTAHAALLADILDVLAGAPLRPRATDVVALREALSASELRVLGYLPSNLSAPEIAAELCVSTSTVKTHMRQIYAKLDAHTRTEAVQRARELGLLGPSTRR